MIRGTTTTGFSFELDEDALDDYELLETLQKIDAGDTTRVIQMVDLLLGEEQKARLKEHIRTEKGRVSASRMIAETMEIFKSCSTGKN